MKRMEVVQNGASTAIGIILVVATVVGAGGCVDYSRVTGLVWTRIFRFDNGLVSNE